MFAILFVIWPEELGAPKMFLKAVKSLTLFCTYNIFLNKLSLNKNDCFLTYIKGCF